MGGFSETGAKLDWEFHWRTSANGSAGGMLSFMFGFYERGTQRENWKRISIDNRSGDFLTSQDFRLSIVSPGAVHQRRAAAGYKTFVLPSGMLAIVWVDRFHLSFVTAPTMEQQQNKTKQNKTKQTNKQKKKDR